MKLSGLSPERQAIVRALKKESDKRYREKHREILNQKKKEYYLANKEAMSLQKKIKYKASPESAKARAKAWKELNRDLHNAQCMARHTRKLKAMPEWLNELMLLGITETYSKARLLSSLRGVPYEVDHIIPLQGKLVCGLHVPWNLQIITNSENCSKNNSMPTEDFWLAKDGIAWIN